MSRQSRQCMALGCSRPVWSRERCTTHYSRWWRRERAVEPCSVASCERVTNARGLCSTHYSSAKRLAALPPARRGRYRYRVELLVDGARWVPICAAVTELLYVRGVLHGASRNAPPESLRIVRLRGSSVVEIARLRDDRVSP